MSTRLHSAPVVVGVDGSDDSDRAIRFAVEEATRLGTGLRLVHAVYETLPMSPMVPLVSSETLDEVGRRIVTDAAARLRELVGGRLAVETVVALGPPARGLLDAAADAALIVLGHRHLSRLGRVFTGSTTIALAARASCPVVCVPAEWTPTPAQPRVVVGVDGSSGSRAAIGAAFEAASRRGGSVTVLHAWRLPDQYDAVAGSPVLEDEWLQESEIILSEILAGWRDSYPDVPVDVELRYERPAAALTEASAKADLVVVGRHGHGGVLGLPLGSIARALVHHSHCPVVLVPDRAEVSSQ
jgi:nucleotide-binding universal stress UspA family protein